MHIRDLQGKNICILGFGREGQATLRALEKYAPDCEMTIADSNPDIGPENSRCWLQVGEGWLKNLQKFDAIIKSPGIPPQPEFEAVRGKITSASQLFLDSIAGTGAIVIGVTGSKGKSTTSSLIHAILKAAGKDAYLVGNIGIPALELLEKAKGETVFVYEMSSYQLMNIERSPHMALVTSFFPEHMDYHGSEASYIDAKKNITRFQGESDVVFFHANSWGAAEIAKEGEGRKIPFSEEDAPVRIEETHLLGLHNLSNIGAAHRVVCELGVPESVSVAAIREFHGLPHRLQSLGIYHEIEWVNDSISTTPESAIAALDALGPRVKTIILGGLDRGYDFTKLGKHIARSNVENVILFPGSGPRIRSAIEAANAHVKFFEADNMEQAVAYAASSLSSSNSSPIVLLSPASPSYNMFKNFEERGNEFQRCIMTHSHPFSPSRASAPSPGTHSHPRALRAPSPVLPER